MNNSNQPSSKGQDVITPTEYAKLSDDEKFYYDPDYRKYKITKYREYQECEMGFSHYMGWAEKRVPIGKPYRYIRDNSITRMLKHQMMPSILDSVFNSNILSKRILEANK